MHYCILSAILGNRTMSQRILDSLGRISDSNRRVLWFDERTYANFPAPRLLRHSSTLEGWYVARRMLRANAYSGLPQENAAITIINGYEIALAQWSLGRSFRPKRLVVALDTTPALTARTRAEMDRPAGSSTLDRAKDILFRRFAHRVVAWLPISEMCRQSLVGDYAVAEDRCFVTRSPQPSSTRAVARACDLKPPYKILFVGNDLKRKGGVLLIEAFRRGLMGDFRLTVVSNDPTVHQYRDSADVAIVTGLREPAAISQFYREADLLVLPTQFDTYGHVISEGLAHGLPFLATRVGGVAEIIDESDAGWSIPASSSVEMLASAVRSAIRDPIEYERRARNAVGFARDHLTFDRFDQTMSGMLLRANSTG
jgi:glycosyltransferase involved in cell wall biosynthesis